MSSYELEFFLKKMPNKRRTIKPLVHKIRLARSTRERNTAESFSREKSRQELQKEGGGILCDPGWYVHKPDVQNKWDDNTHNTVAPNAKVPTVTVFITGSSRFVLPVASVACRARGRALIKLNYVLGFPSCRTRYISQVEHELSS